jgi:hypothetical protein
MPPTRLVSPRPRCFSDPVPAAGYRCGHAAAKPVYCSVRGGLSLADQRRLDQATPWQAKIDRGALLVVWMLWVYIPSGRALSRSVGNSTSTFLDILPSVVTRAKVRQSHPAFEAALQTVKRQVRVAAQTPATLVARPGTRVLAFSEEGPYPGVHLALNGVYAFQLPLPLFQCAAARPNTLAPRRLLSPPGG